MENQKRKLSLSFRFRPSRSRRSLFSQDYHAVPFIPPVMLKLIQIRPPRVEEPVALIYNGFSGLRTVRQVNFELASLLLDSML
jgi:hypothetical protein